MITVHMIGNAHLDPVWLWRRSDGVDAALATARSACDRLDEFDDFIFTCSTVWFHEQIRRLDPALFERVRAFVAAGRWRLVGPMVVQPDCNLPSAASYPRHFQRGKTWFREAFGVDVTVGYNVDSFGHNAYLPRLLREAGLDSYVFMRPAAGEMTLPTNLFRWRSPDGHEVTTFRITGAYCTRTDDLKDHVRAALEATPDGAEHTMCFFGVGDHGGGPTRAQIRWVRDNASAIDGARLIFSHPRAFFDAVAETAGDLPVVDTELQHHAIGSYSVERRLKVGVRRAEARLVQTEQVLRLLAKHVTADDEAVLRAAWDRVLFNQFHDILGGTSVDEASRIAAGECVAAEADAVAVATAVTRRAFRDHAAPGEHRIVVFNPGDDDFDGWVEHESFLNAFDLPAATLTGPDGALVPFQEVPTRSLIGHMRGLVARVALEAGRHKVLRLNPPAVGAAGGEPPRTKHPAAATPDELGNGLVTARLADGGLRVGAWRIGLEICDDPTDTWGHEAGAAFDGEVVAPIALPSAGEPIEHGAARATWRLSGKAAGASLWGWASVYADVPAVRLRLAVTWPLVRRRLRCRIAAGGPISERVDLVSGGPLARAANGEEYPLNGGMQVATAGERLAIVAPEIFSASVTPEAVDLTLLRSPFAAHNHGRRAEDHPDRPATDQGRHAFELLLLPGFAGPPSALERAARQMLAPPLVWDLTG